MDIKKLASSPLSGFRHKEVPVPEWGNVKVIIREPSAPDWAQWQSALRGKVAVENEDAATNSELGEAQDLNLGIEIEAMLFSAILYDTKGLRVFTADDLGGLIQHYGPVHTRLLNEAIQLAGIGGKPLEDAEKK